MKKFLTLTALLISALLLAEEADTGKDKAAGEARQVGRQQMQREGRRGANPQMQENIIKRMRENADALLKKYDADGDGKLNDVEKAALEKDMKLVEELFPLSITYKRLKLIDKDGDFQISDEEAANIDLEAIRENMQRDRPGMRPERTNRPERPAPRKEQPKTED